MGVQFEGVLENILKEKKSLNIYFTISWIKYLESY